MPARKKRAEAALKGWNKRKKTDDPLHPLRPTNRPKTLKKWDDKSMLAAIEAVCSGKYGANQAVRFFSVPPSTLKDRLSGRVKHGDKSGPAPYLTLEEENELADFLVKCSQIGYGKTRREVIGIVQRTLKKKGKPMDRFNGEGWWQRFMQRHPILSLRTSDPLSRVRSNAVTAENMANYFALLKTTLDDNHKPSRIYNMDESGMPLDHKQLKRVALKGMKKLHGQASGDKTQKQLWLVLMQQATPSLLW